MLDPEFKFKKYALVYGKYNHEVDIFFDLDFNIIRAEDYFDTHNNTDKLFLLDVYTNIAYVFYRGKGEEYSVIFGFSDKVFKPYFTDLWNREEKKNMSVKEEIPVHKSHSNDSGKVKLITSSNGVMFADVPFDKGVISRPTKG